MILSRYGSKEEGEAALEPLGFLEIPAFVEGLEVILGPDAVLKITPPSSMFAGFGQTQPIFPAGSLSTMVLPGGPPNPHASADFLAGFAQLAASHNHHNPALLMFPPAFGPIPPNTSPGNP